MVFRKITRRLEQPHAMQATRLQSRSQFVPEGNDEILGRGNDAAQERDLLVQVSVVTPVHDGRVQELF